MYSTEFTAFPLKDALLAEGCLPKDAHRRMLAEGWSQKKPLLIQEGAFILLFQKLRIIVPKVHSDWGHRVKK